MVATRGSSCLLVRRSQHQPTGSQQGLNRVPAGSQQGAARRAGLAAGAAVWGVRGGGARHAAGPGARARAHLAREQLHAGTPPMYPNPICSSPVPNIQRLLGLSWAWCPRWCARGARAAACRRAARIGKTLHQNNLILSHSGCVNGAAMWHMHGRDRSAQQWPVTHSVHGVLPCKKSLILASCRQR